MYKQLASRIQMQIMVKFLLFHDKEAPLSPIPDKNRLRMRSGARNCKKLGMFCQNTKSDMLINNVTKRTGTFPEEWHHPFECGSHRIFIVTLKYYTSFSETFLRRQDHGIFDCYWTDLCSLWASKVRFFSSTLLFKLHRKTLRCTVAKV